MASTSVHARQPPTIHEPESAFAHFSLGLRFPLGSSTTGEKDIINTQEVENEAEAEERSTEIHSFRSAERNAGSAEPGSSLL